LTRRTAKDIDVRDSYVTRRSISSPSFASMIMTSPSSTTKAVNLACEHIGITRTRSDSFFDGSIGQRLAKSSHSGIRFPVPDPGRFEKGIVRASNEERDVVGSASAKELDRDAWLRTGIACAAR